MFESSFYFSFGTECYFWHKKVSKCLKKIIVGGGDQKNMVDVATSHIPSQVDFAVSPGKMWPRNVMKQNYDQV